MSGSSPEIAIRISASDADGTKTVDAFSKRLEQLEKRTARYTRTAGDTSGVSRFRQGIQGLSGEALGLARSLERASGATAAITSAATIGGVAELTARWAQAGTTIGKVAYRLNEPVGKLSALEGAARLAGSSAGTMDASLQGLQETITSVFYNKQTPDPLATSLMNQFGISAKDAHGHLRNVADVLPQIADIITNRYGGNPHAQAAFLQHLGISPDLLPLLNKGGKGLEEYLGKARQTGGVMTGEMAANATKMNEAWNSLALTIEGVGNHVVNSWSGTVTKVLDGSAHWIQRNKDLADSIGQIGTGVGLLAALKPAAWVLRLLGLGAVVDSAPLAVPLALTGDAGPGPQPDGRNGWNFSGNGSGSAATAAPAPIALPRGPSNAAAVMQRVHDYFRGKGLSEAQTAGILANVAAESGFDPTKVGDNGTSYGLFQEHADRLAAMQRRFGTATPSLDQQLDYAWWELQGPKAGVLEGMRMAHTPQENGAIFSNGFEVPAGGPAEGVRRGDAAGQFMGTVQVDVRLHNAGQGTTAHATASGIATVTPPRVETGMSFAR